MAAFSGGGHEKVRITDLPRGAADRKAVKPVQDRRVGFSPPLGGYHWWAEAHPTLRFLIIRQQAAGQALDIARLGDGRMHRMIRALAAAFEQLHVAI